MKIHIFGASGAGSTTQGLDLSQALAIPYFDSDSYFWEVSDPPFTIRRSPEQRTEMLRSDLSTKEHYIVGGSLVSWGEEWKKTFDLAVFLYIPSTIRLARLRKRELERYGDIIFTDHDRNRLYNEFMDWAASYDDNNDGRRSLDTHLTWMEELECPVMTIKDDLSVEQRRNLILAKIASIS